MTTDTALIEKREELKRRLTTGEYKTLVDIFLEWFDRLLRKITRRSKPFPLWLIAALLSIIINFISFMLIYVAGDFTKVPTLMNFTGLGAELRVLISLVFANVFIITMLMLISQHIGIILVLWRDEMLDATDSLESLDKFEDWLKKTSNWRLHLLIAIIFGLINGLYSTSITNNISGEFTGYGYTFSNIIMNVFTFAFIYLFLMVILLLARLRGYDLKLYSSDPSSSELIYHLSKELGFFIYIVAAYAAITTLASAPIGILQTLGFVLVLILWFPIIVMFILNQASLSSIIRRVKWKTLNEVQAKIEKLRASKNFGSPKTMDAINRLMDYHDRVKATRDSALDFRTYLSFINSLLLPLLAFLLGNLDLVLSLFARKP